MSCPVVAWGQRSPSLENNKRRELTAEEKEQQELKKIRPIKAATNGMTSSVFNDPLISKFTNMIMKGGDKTLEHMKRKQVEKYHKAPQVKKDKIECNPYTIFHQAMENCKPVIGLVSIQRGGKFYQVPVPLSDSRRRYLAMNWMITECRENRDRRMHVYEKLSQELLMAFEKEGNVVKKKHEMHKMAESNRAYAHYRWW
ncbi:hypothetical protein CRUP_000423 [Coryphaenoides rupestris]|nr:hypothetical protein CRUP_000423 [Coryphaenoides rupestris]